MEKRIPFQNLNVQNWQNFALFALLGFYFGKIILELYADNLFNTIGSDFLAFWTVGHIANTHGYAYIYDLSLLANIQKPFHEIVVTDNVYAPVPAAFFSFFTVPFQLLAILNAKTGYAAWSIFDLIGLIFYLRFFIKDLISKQIQPRLMALFVILYPVYLNLFWGQINVWLAICVGEFMRPSIMKSYNFPEGKTALHYKSVAPINTFRIIVNTYPNRNFEPLDDKTYFSLFDVPYKLIDITSTVRNKCGVDH